MRFDLEGIKDASRRATICRQVLEDLPGWFGDHMAREHYIAQSRCETMLAAFTQNQTVGMVTLHPHAPANMEIRVMGVRPRYHRKGAGIALLGSAAERALDMGVRMLSVKTLSRRSPDANYARTREFYAAVGFELFEEFPTLWGENNPCAVYILPLKSNRAARLIQAQIQKR